MPRTGGPTRIAAAILFTALALLGGPAMAAAPSDRESALAPLAAPPSQLDAVRADGPGTTEVIRVDQTVAGLPVLGGEAVIVDPAGEPPREVADSTYPGLEADPVADPIAGSRAVEIALRALRGRDAELSGEPELAVDPATERVVWRVLASASAPAADLELLIGAADGEIVSQRDLTLRLRGRARIYKQNPVVIKGAYSGLSDRDDAAYPRINRLRRAARLERLRGSAGCLRGRAVRVTVGRERKRVCRPSRNWRGVRRAAPAFEALMAYWHVDRAHSYLDSLGLSRPVFSSPLDVAANAIGPDNSYFLPNRDAILLGRGGVDDGEDGDIIVHEYGHAIQDAQVRDFGSSADGASIGEGFGDYIAAAMASELGAPARFQVCVGEWDSVSYDSRPSCLRRTDSQQDLRQAKGRCGGDPHCIGEVWSGALWDLRRELGEDTSGRAIVDRLVLESHFLLTSRSGFGDSARALLEADAALYPDGERGAHSDQIEREMKDRGFCKPSGC